MEGRATTRPGDGTFVARRGGPISTAIDHTWQTVVLGRAPELNTGLDYLAVDPSATVISLDNGFPDPALQAQQLLAKAATRCARQATAWDRCPTQGLPALRDVFAREAGEQFTSADVLITPGAQAALDTVLRSLAGPGDVVVLEDPGYPGAVVAAVNCGLRPTPAPTDEYGILPEALAAVLATTAARIVVVQPRHANPTGSILPIERRRAVLAIAREFGCFIVEDDWVRDLDIDGPSGPALVADDADGHVISIRSVSKSAAPGLRIAGVIARGPVLARLTHARLAADFFVAPLMQAVAADVLASGGWQRHLVSLRSTLAARRDVLLDELHRHAPDLGCRRPSGGVALWLRLPLGVDDRALTAACLQRGVRVAPGHPFTLTEPERAHIRVAFNRSDPDVLIVAAQRIADALNSL